MTRANAPGQLPAWMRAVLAAVSLLLAGVAASAVWTGAAGAGPWRAPLAALALLLVALGLPLAVAGLALRARPRRRT